MVLSSWSLSAHVVSQGLSVCLSVCGNFWRQVHRRSLWVTHRGCDGQRGPTPRDRVASPFFLGVGTVPFTSIGMTRTRATAATVATPSRSLRVSWAGVGPGRRPMIPPAHVPGLPGRSSQEPPPGGEGLQAAYRSGPAGRTRAARPLRATARRPRTRSSALCARRPPPPLPAFAATIPWLSGPQPATAVVGGRHRYAHPPHTIHPTAPNGPQPPKPVHVGTESWVTSPIALMPNLSTAAPSRCTESSKKRRGPLGALQRSLDATRESRVLPSIGLQRPERIPDGKSPAAPTALRDRP